VIRRASPTAPRPLRCRAQAPAARPSTDRACSPRHRGAVERASRLGYARRVATLHFIYGWPGAGKTTLARDLGERARAVVFCEDERLTKLASESITRPPQEGGGAAR